MIYKIVCVRDRIANIFGVPNFVSSVGMAIRGFGDEINRADEKNPFYMHPDDFDLYEVGDYDDDGASFVCLPQPRQVAVGRDLKREK